MAKRKKYQYGDLSPQYHFALNPYSDLKCSKCPDCRQRTGQRKLPLLLFIKPSHSLVLNFTCRYCAPCDMLICHQGDLEHELATICERRDPLAIGNDYFVLGTLEKRVWREGLAQARSISDLLPQLHDFRSYRDIRMTVGGLFKIGQEPPVRTPPPPTEWVKRLEE
jgi:hypothetical protein